MKKAIVSLALFLSIFAPAAFAQSIAVSIQIKHPPLKISVTPNPSNNPLNCSAPTGTVVDSISTTGGDGSPVTFTLTGDTVDFAISAATVIVGPKGITPANCGTTQWVTITASQS